MRRAVKSFVVVAVKARLQGLDPSLEEASRDLYADSRATFQHVTFPLVAPGIAGAALLGFALSFDDFIISFFNNTVEKIFKFFAVLQKPLSQELMKFWILLIY